ncbi:DnaT-like ssDNA-binding domain-containing protein [Neptunomonas sp.]|uniref:DnaT-like ssDNA-binding domain-containing protein n=1 Tax=Neptunomonas sp. TaxID=1971898 RepID=UPI0035619242
MSITIPEKPLFVYPSLARKLGVEAALLFYICHEQLSIAGIPDKSGKSEAMLSAQQWLSLTDFWTREKVAELLSVLTAHSPVSVIINAGGSVRISEIAAQNATQRGAQGSPLRREESVSQPVKTTAASVFSSPPNSEKNRTSGSAEEPAFVAVNHHKEQQDELQRIARLPIVDAPPPYPRRPLPSRNNMRDRGPAPAFGGSIGWKRQKDELQQLFDRHEERNQQLHMMHLGWTPSDMFFSILPRHQIPREFVETCLDEFILYYIDKERKESNWDQKFLAWVKREWVQKQTRDAREQRNEQQRNQQPRHSSGSGINDENTRRDTKEKRKRVTAAIMDIKDTDW